MGSDVKRVPDVHGKRSIKCLSKTYGVLLRDMYQLDPKKVGTWIYMTDTGQSVRALIDAAVVGAGTSSVMREESPEQYLARLATDDRVLIVISHYGLMGFPKETLTQIAARKNLSVRKVSDLRWKGVRRLKSPSYARIRRIIERERSTLI